MVGDAIFDMIGDRPRFPQCIPNVLFLVHIQFGMIVAEFNHNLQNEVIHGGHIHFGDGIEDLLGFLVGHMRWWVGDRRLWNEGWGGQS